MDLIIVKTRLKEANEKFIEMIHDKFIMTPEENPKMLLEEEDARLMRKHAII